MDIGTLFHKGNASFSYLAVTGTATLDVTNNFVVATANSFTINLPTAVGITGRTFFIKNNGTGVITIDANGSEKIDGELTIELSQRYSSVIIFSDGANWLIGARN